MIILIFIVSIFSVQPAIIFRELLTYLSLLALLFFSTLTSLYFFGYSFLKLNNFEANFLIFFHILHIKIATLLSYMLRPPSI